MKEFLDEVDLDPTAAIRHIQDDEDRRRSMVMEKVRATFMRRARDVELRAEFDRLLTDLAERRDAKGLFENGNRREANLLVVVGETGAGKTTSLERMFATHPAFPGYGNAEERCKLVTVTADSPCNFKELGITTLAHLGYRIERARVEAPEVWRKVRYRLPQLGIICIHFDEMQHVTQTIDKLELVKLRNCLKALLIDKAHPICIVISGQPALLPFICGVTEKKNGVIVKDRQLARRASFVEFRALDRDSSADRTFATKVAQTLAKVAGLGIGDDFETVVVPRLLHAASHAQGIMIEEVQEAIRKALADPVSPHLTLAHFASAYASRTGNRAPWNPYLADEWWHVDPTLVLMTREPIPEPRAKGKK